MLLAIDTSTQLAGVSIYDGSVRAELAWVAGRSHSVQLLRQIKRLLELLGTDVAALTAVAAARGPGSFTGVRVGLAVAQGLAVALDVPAYGVCSLDVLAGGQETSALPVRPLLDVGRGRFATALYESQNGRMERFGEIVGVQLEDIPDLVDRPCLLCGELDSATRERLRGILGERVAMASPAASVRRPAVLAQLGWDRHLTGSPGEPAALEPLYLAR